MTATGLALMAAGVWIVLGAPDLSGATVFGAVVYLAGLWVVQGSYGPWRRAPRDSTDRAVDDAAARMVER